jgi:hypothetical protein
MASAEPTVKAAAAAAFLGAWCAVLLLAACSSDEAAAPAPQESAASEPDVVWIIDHETGDLSQWDGKRTSRKADAVITAEHAHGGKYALAATIYQSRKAGNAVRMRIEGRQWAPPTSPENLPDRAYYSVWYLIPQPFVGNNNILQWKQAELVDDLQHKRLTLSVSIRDGRYLALRTRIDDRGEWVKPSIGLDTSEIPVPFGRWFHLECLYEWNKTPDGRVICWQDEVEILRAEGIITERDLPWRGYPRQCTVNNYGISPQDPRTYTIYIDDVVVSRTRVGVGPPAQSR